MHSLTGSEPVYFNIPGLEQQYFECKPLRLSSISVPCCASRFDEAQLGERFLTCRKCPIGARHAGRPEPTSWTTKLCSRCRRMAPRMIGNRLCVSCYNRERETLKGRNAKGGAPKKLSLDRLQPASVRIGSKAQGAVVFHLERSTSFAEAVIAAAHAHGPRGFFARESNVPGGTSQ